MATTTGRDVILTLMADVAELHENALTATKHLEQLVKLSRDSSKRTKRIARTLAKVATLIGDHEQRISALEARH